MLTLRLATSRIYSVRSIYPLNCQLSHLRTLAAFANSAGGSLKIGKKCLIVTLLLSSNFGLVT